MEGWSDGGREGCMNGWMGGGSDGGREGCMNGWMGEGRERHEWRDGWKWI